MEKTLKIAARAGNPQAIQQLLTKALQAQGITVRTVRNETKLIILLSAETTPDSHLVNIIKKGLDTIQPQGIRTVSIRAQTIFSTKVAWTKQWYLDLPTPSNQHQFTTSTAPNRLDSSAPLPATFHSQDVSAPTVENIWQAGDWLVIRRDAQLPDRCIKTNKPAHGKRYRVELRWLPWWRLLLRITSPVSIIRAYERATIYVGMTAIQVKKLKRQIFWNWVTGALGLSFFLTPLMLPIAKYPEWVAWIMGLGVLLCVRGIVMYEITHSPIHVVWIKGDFICVRGVSRAYLRHFPYWEISE